MAAHGHIDSPSQPALIFAVCAMFIQASAGFGTTVTHEIHDTRQKADDTGAKTSSPEGGSNGRRDA